MCPLHTVRLKEQGIIYLPLLNWSQREKKGEGELEGGVGVESGEGGEVQPLIISG